MPGPRVLFVNHTSTVAGGELVLLVTAILAGRKGQPAQLDRAMARAMSHYGVVPMRARAVDLIGRVILEARSGVAATRPATA